MASPTNDDWLHVVGIAYDSVKNKDGGIVSTLARTLDVNGLFQVGLTIETLNSYFSTPKSLPKNVSGIFLVFIFIELAR